MKKSLGYMLGIALRDLGVERAYGVMGGNIARLVSGLEEAGINLIHTRHESGAAFMATEDSLYTGRPAVVFTTTGPGWTNSLTGLIAATYEGAKILVLTGATESEFNSDLYFQPQHGGVLTALRSLSAPHARVEFSLIRSENDLYKFLDKWHSDMKLPGGVLGTALVPVDLQKKTVNLWILRESNPKPVVEISDKYFSGLSKILLNETTVIWLGWGARNYSDSIRQLVERIGAYVLCSPRAKGIYPESDVHYLGTTGHAAREDTLGLYRSLRPSNLLILGSRLTELTTYWESAYAPMTRIFHVDTNHQLHTNKFLSIPITTIVSDIGTFIERLLSFIPQSTISKPSIIGGHYITKVQSNTNEGLHPSQVISAIQTHVLDVYSDVYVAAEGGNAWAWGPHALIFDKPRWRLSTNWASMGHFSSGIVGLALASHKPAVAIVGDGAMLMQAEVSTAVQHQAPAKWLVWNDAGYGMIRHGLNAINLPPMNVDIPRVDFAEWATSQGALGISVQSIEELEEAIEASLNTNGPVVVDIPIDPAVPPPFGRRNDALTEVKASEWSS